MEIKNFVFLIDHYTFIFGKTPRKDELIITVKLVLKAKQTASGKLEKLKACIVAQSNNKERRIKKTRATVQKQIQKQRQENAEITATIKTNTIPLEIP
jgi:septal ring factor EnvC (AmiA/AmiB activator)